MQKRHVLSALAVLATLSFVLPAVAATPSPLKVAKKALRVGKSAERKAKRANRAARRAMAAANNPGPRGATGTAGVQGIQGTAGPAGGQGATGAMGAAGVSHAYGASSPNSVLLNPSSEMSVAVLNGLPTGKYLIQGKVRIGSTTAAARAVTCTLYDGSTTLDSDTSTVDSTTSADNYRVVPFLAIRNKTGPEDVTIKCQLATGSSGEAVADFPDIAAIAVDQLN